MVKFYQVRMDFTPALLTLHKIDGNYDKLEKYDTNYCDHPRLANLIKLNNISDRDFLSGKSEAEAFLKKEYVKLHQSTLRKVLILSIIVDKLGNGNLKTYAKKKDIYGSYFAYFIEIIRENWIIAIIGILGSLASIAALLIWFLTSK